MHVRVNLLCDYLFMGIGGLSVGQELVCGLGFVEFPEPIYIFYLLVW